MRRLLLCFLFLTALQPIAAVRAQQPPVPATAAHYAGGDGTTLRKAIVIEGAGDVGQGEAAEQAWIDKNLPGAAIQSRGRITGPPHYDVLTVKLASGVSMDLHFDISAFFGK